MAENSGAPIGAALAPGEQHGAELDDREEEGSTRGTSNACCKGSSWPECEGAGFASPVA